MQVFTKKKSASFQVAAPSDNSKLPGREPMMTALELVTRVRRVGTDGGDEPDGLGRYPTRPHAV